MCSTKQKNTASAPTTANDDAASTTDATSTTTAAGIPIVTVGAASASAPFIGNINDATDTGAKTPHVSSISASEAAPIDDKTDLLLVRLSETWRGKPVYLLPCNPAWLATLFDNSSGVHMVELVDTRDNASDILLYVRKGRAHEDARGLLAAAKNARGDNPLHPIGLEGAYRRHILKAYYLTTTKQQGDKNPNTEDLSDLDNLDEDARQFFLQWNTMPSFIKRSTHAMLKMLSDGASREDFAAYIDTLPKIDEEGKDQSGYIALLRNTLTKWPEQLSEEEGASA